MAPSKGYPTRMLFITMIFLNTLSFFGLIGNYYCDAFSTPKMVLSRRCCTSSPSTTTSSSSLAAAATMAENDVELVTSDDERFLNMAGKFLVDAFWLNSPHHFKDYNDDGLAPDDMSEDAKLGLIVEQCSDLQEKYGERMGQRLLKSVVVGALDSQTKALVGLVTLKESLLLTTTSLVDDENDGVSTSVILDAEKAEAMAVNAVASLGPKERRLYKNVSIDKIASKLLTDIPSSNKKATTTAKAVVVLSNLAVSPSVRRQGIAQMLCQEAEYVTADDWDYTHLHLLVEKENELAYNLYSKKLGYETLFEMEDAKGVRIDLQEGSFKEIEVPTLVMAKKV